MTTEVIARSDFETSAQKVLHSNVLEQRLLEFRHRLERLGHRDVLARVACLQVAYQRGIGFAEIVAQALDVRRGVTWVC